VRRDLAAAVTVLGIGERRAEEFLDAERTRALAAAGRTAADVERAIAERAAARAARDWRCADALRRDLLEAGIALEDGASGTTWRPASWGLDPPGRKGGRR
jgi:cysteinyl-tRNA synthetase